MTWEQPRHCSACGRKSTDSRCLCGVYEPSQTEIADQTRIIRSTWTEKEFYRRSNIVPDPLGVTRAKIVMGRR